MSRIAQKIIEDYKAHYSLPCEPASASHLEDCIDSAVAELEAKNAALRKALNTPELHDFAKGVISEAQHQRQRWGTDHDAGKLPEDWFWLLGYLAGKCLAAHKNGNNEKALHHMISTAAALANWHSAILGLTNMRPGIDTPADLGDGGAN